MKGTKVWEPPRRARRTNITLQLTEDERDAIRAAIEEAEASEWLSVDGDVESAGRIREAVARGEAEIVAVLLCDCEVLAGALAMGLGSLDLYDDNAVVVDLICRIVAELSDAAGGG